MPALLLSLLPLLGKFAPDLVGLAFGGQAAAVASKVEAAIRDIFGTTDPAVVDAAVAADPTKGDALQTRLDAETERLKDQLADVESARVSTLELAKAGSPIAWGSPVISIVVVAAFAVVAVVVFARYGVESAVGQLIAGALIAKFSTVVDYWLGSSKGSTDRSDAILSMLHQTIGGPAAAVARKAGR